MIQLFPNPCNGTFYISNKIKEPIYCKKLTLYDQYGNCILENHIEKFSENLKVVLLKPPIGEFIVEIDFKFCCYYSSITILKRPPKY